MARRYHYAPATKAQADEATQMDLDDDRERAQQDFPTGRLANFGAGANHRTMSGEVHSAIEASGGDPAKYLGSGWSAEAVRTVEADRHLSQRDWD
jgi:hypothetical protein